VLVCLSTVLVALSEGGSVGTFYILAVGVAVLILLRLMVQVLQIGFLTQVPELLGILGFLYYQGL